MSAILSVNLLGRFSVEYKGSPVENLSYNKARALLAYLAVEPGPHRREFLADLLWPGDSNGRENLRRMLNVLRSALGAEGAALLVSLGRHSLFLDRSGVAVDAAGLAAAAPQCRNGCDPEWRALCIGEAVRIAGLYRGAFLPGFAMPDSPEFELWLEAKRAQMQGHALVLLERISHCLERSGDQSGALDYARRTLEADSGYEAGYRRIMRLLAGSGQNEAALTEYRACERVLREDFGVAPETQTQALALTLSAAEAALAEAPMNRPLSVVAVSLAADEREDPERAAQHLVAPEALCRDALQRAGGHLTTGYGGNLLAWFGYPEAHERAALHAVAAALECAALSDERVTIGAGIHCGQVVSEPARKLVDRLGATTREAWRLAHRAAPGEARISAAARERVHGYFLYAPAGNTLGEEAAAMRVTGASGAQTRLDLTPPQGHSPLQGRHAEVASLYAHWRTVRAGGSAMLLLRGDAGIGKSRLLQALCEQAGANPVWEIRCQPSLMQAPFQPVLRLWAKVLDISDGDGEEPILRKLSALAMSQPQRALLARLLSCEPQALSAMPADKATIIKALLAPLPRLTHGSAALLLIEDAHWADTSTAQWLAQLAQALPAGLLVAVAARPEFTPLWGAPLILALPPLEREAAEALLNNASDGALSAQRIAQLLRLADGVPLYLEELARMVAPGRAGTRVEPIPATLHDLLLARIDALGKHRRSAELAASVGREFSGELFAAAGAATLKTDAADGLAAMLDAGLVYRGRNGNYAFKHALLREAAYRSQGRETRRASHLALVAALTEHDPARPAREPEWFAWHFGGAEEHSHAADCLILAGQRATERSAYDTAVAHLQSALDTLAQLSDDGERARRELAANLVLTVPLAAVHGYGSPQARAACQRALELAGLELDGPAHSDPALFPLIWGLWLGSSSLSDFNASQELALKLVELGEKTGNARLRAHAYYALGNTLFCLGQFRAAAAALETAAATCPEGGPGPLGEDAGVTANAFLSWAYWFLGQGDAALAASQRALERARRIGHPHSLGFALAFAGCLHRYRREPMAARALGEEALQLAEDHNLALWGAAGHALRGWGRAAANDPAGLAEIISSVGGLSDVMGGIEAIFLGIMLDACERCRAWPEALQTAEMGLAAAEKRADTHLLAEFHRVKGVALAALDGDTTEIEAALSTALATAQKQDSPTLALRAAVSLTRWLGTQNRGEGCRTLLEKWIARCAGDAAENADLSEAVGLLGAIA